MWRDGADDDAEAGFAGARVVLGEWEEKEDEETEGGDRFEGLEDAGYAG